MARWQPMRFERKTVQQNLGDGINTSLPPFDIKDSEATYMRNIGSQNYPAMSVRYGRTFYSTAMSVTTPNGIGERANSQFHVIDGVNWKAWSTSSTGGFTTLTTALTSTDGKILDFNTGTARYTILMNSTQRKYWDGTSSALNLGDTTMPYTKIFAIHKGRIFAARGATLYYCAFNLINDWSTPNDAGSITIARARGDISAVCEFNDKIIVFTEFSMHELYGDSPSNFELIDIEGEVGCYGDKSIVKCNKRLYWYWNDGIYEYNGGSPIKISSPVDAYIKAINYTNRLKVASGSNGDLLYIGIPYNSTNNSIVLVYDTKIQKWFIETGNFHSFVSIKNKVYGMDTTGGIMDMRDETSYLDNGVEIQWDYRTKAYTEGTVSQKKALDNISTIYDSTASTLNVSYSTDDTSTSFTVLANTSDLNVTGIKANTLLRVPLSDLQDESFYRLRFNGTGRTNINRLEKNYLIKR